MYGSFNRFPFGELTQDTTQALHHNQPTTPQPKLAGLPCRLLAAQCRLISSSFVSFPLNSYICDLSCRRPLLCIGPCWLFRVRCLPPICRYARGSCRFKRRRSPWRLTDPWSSGSSVSTQLPTCSFLPPRQVQGRVYSSKGGFFFEQRSAPDGAGTFH